MQNDDNPLKAEKRRKLHDLKKLGLDPFPHTFLRTHKVEEIIKAHADLQTGETREGIEVSMAGRLMTVRAMGKASFFNFQDQSGSLQAYIRLEELAPEHRQFFDLVDIGDIVGLKGFIFKTKKGELSIHCKSFQILCKTLEPLLEEYNGIADVELKYRARHLDLIMNHDSRKVFEARSQVIREIRRFLDNRGFMEVETPTLQPQYGGAAAHPFTTHHRALDMKLYLKVSPELYLKRLIVGGFEKVYEIGKNFRNEGIDRSHNPEFTMLEWYEAYTDYEYQMKQFEELVAHVCQTVKGSTKIQYQGKEIDFTTPWRRITVYDSIKEYGGFDVSTMSADEIFNKVKEHGSELKKPASHGEMVMEAWDLFVEKNLWNPTFITDFPVEISPLTKSHRSGKKGIVERFEPVCAGMEIGNSYTELNDPEDQRTRLEEQEKQRATNEEAYPMDEDFVHAIEVGMPPTGGVGIGIDRIVILLTDQPSIRDILFFPTMKPHKN